MTESKTPMTLGLYTNWLFEKAGTPYFATYRGDLMAIAYGIERLESALADALAAKERAESERDATMLRLANQDDEMIALARKLAEYRHALLDVRLSLHAAGRRSETCYEMSVIDDAIEKESKDEQ